MDTSEPAGPEAGEDDRPPSAPEVQIWPDAPTEADDLHCRQTVPAVDPEGQPVHHTLRWSVNGEDTEHQTDLLDADLTRGGDTWTCTVVASDGVQEGPAGSDTVQVAVPNRPPGAPVVEVRPTTPGANHTLACHIVEDASDPDGDTVEHRVRWSHNGVETALQDATLASEWTAEGDDWTCTVTPWDGAEEGTPGTDTVRIGAPAYSGDLTAESGVVYDASGCAYCPDNDWYIADRAFDDRTGTGAESWVVPWTGGPEWISVDFGAGNEKTITHYGLMGSAFHEGYRARDWQFEGSDDEATWIVLHTVTDANLAYVMYGGEPFTHYSFANSEAYRHYRLLVTENRGGQPYNNELGIVEIEMMEDAPAE